MYLYDNYSFVGSLFGWTDQSELKVYWGGWKAGSENFQQFCTSLHKKTCEMLKDERMMCMTISISVFRDVLLSDKVNSVFP